MLYCLGHMHISAPTLPPPTFALTLPPKTSEMGKSGTSFFLAHAGSLAEVNTELLLLRKDKY